MLAASADKYLVPENLYRLACWRRTGWNWHTDLFRYVIPSYGPNVFVDFCGGRPEFGRDTVWHEPVITSLDKAERMIRKALALEGDPPSASVLDSLGWVLYKAGKIADAARIFTLILAMEDVKTGDTAGGLIDFPDRVGFLNLKPGDYVFYDNYGWPIVISAESMTSGSSWTHS